MSELKLKDPCQNIDIHLYQTREALQWKARIVCGVQTFVLGPSDIASLMANVSNFMHIETLYADGMVHNEEDIAAAMKANKPRKKSEYSK